MSDERNNGLGDEQVVAYETAESQHQTYNKPKRNVYVCPNCGHTKFLQIVKEEHDKVYDSETHVIERCAGMSVGSIWTCLKCKTPIPLKLLHNLFMGVSHKGFILLDVAEKIKELDEFRRTRIGE